jgi:polysaccharide export outer membrane protein
MIRRHPRLRPARLLALALLLGAAGAAPPLAAQAASAQVPAPDDTAAARIQPGDLVRITVWRQPEMSGEYAVAPDGSITHPLYREVRIAGLSPLRAEQELRAFLTRFEQNPHLVLEPRFRVSVGGEVRQPNLYSVAPGTTVQQVVALAGGPTENGRLSAVQLIRDGRIRTLDLTAPRGDIARLAVASGDQVVVRRRSNVLRDVVGPIASLAAAAAAVVSVIVQ